MKNKKIKVLPTVDNYSLDLVNCFERSFGLCVNMKGYSFSDLLFMMNDFVRSYGIAGKEFSIFEREIFLCEQLFHLDIKKNVVFNELKTCIKDCLVKDCLVLVPGNLKELYYADQYKEIDWPHLFLITGFDEKKQLFYLMDSTQLKSNDPQEKEFVIDQDYLTKIFIGYFEAFQTTGPSFILSVDFSKSIEKKEKIVQNCFELILSRYEKKLVYQEVILMKQIKNIQNEIYSIFNMPKRKKFLYERLRKLCLEYYLIDEETSINMINEENKLIELWQMYINIFYKNKLQRVSLIDEDLLSQIRIKEEYLERIIKKATSKFLNNLSASKGTQDVTKEGGFNFENNEDKIIFKKENKYCFTFQENKLYNTWIDDECPKVFIDKRNNTDFNIRICIKENSYNTDFVAGIYIRTTSDLFFFGIDSCRRINIDKTKKINSIKQYIGEVKKADLRIRFEDGECNFYYRINEEYILLHKEVLEDEMIEYGLSCKTYTKAQPLKICFEVLNDCERAKI
ncbi:hypothetical protein CKN86_01320 [Carnobacterium divergens]|uniref:hypothetical protein n=1 Tax=Carnobacterium divergens TaxID=2748 RepID=UPI000D42898E|nr:hypothetical protein [Carnobacterium divergens]MCO6018454.1 hypothetical protein [Carnobacterium divergens]TFI65222.1 hypothetical protein CKN62_01320 [Carnobacterium divergens]TFI92112.1 hypothetical protein CKN84_01320 [Carnobacterium divergens]TFJ07335.1 hypothetical protein CKN86_01320 [Carnobacterium divergens]TFJ08566.1 hypothetical protein CKN65_01320 [Carnobacterium divergens]